MVEGLPVENVYKTSSPYQNSTSAYAAVSEEQELNPHRQNPIKKYQDVGWAAAFIAHLLVVFVFIAMGMQSAHVNNSSGSSGAIIMTVSVTGLTAITIACSALSFMMHNSEMLVQTALIFSVLSSLAVGILGFVVGSMMMGILGFISFAIGICYAKIVWPRIPFAAANLKTALTAVRQNMGLTAAAFGFTGIAFVWTILWFLGLGSSLSDSNLGVVFLLVSDHCTVDPPRADDRALTQLPLSW
jgi:hypothetical protein